MALNISSSGLVSIQNNIGQANEKLGANLKKLSTGLRINRAADDAAGLAISEKLWADLASLNQAAKNVSAGSSLLRTAEGGLGQISGMLTRQRELSVQAANGTLDDAARQTINREFNAINDEINRITATTEFNGQKLLNGDLGPTSAGPTAIQVGMNDSPDDRININAVENTNTDTLGTANASIDTAENARNAIASIDNALQQVTTSRANVGALSSRFQSAATNISVQRENLTATESRIRDLDFAEESSMLSRNQILQQVGISTLKRGLKQQENLIGGLLSTRA